ncbi:MAG TPA: anti-sigma factor antagonist [Phycisphaerales bacterium]|nr:anti-sigma factor antagonist [Phycisphaerales bacterium]
MDNASLQIDIETAGTVTVIIPLGDIDLSKSSDLRNALQPVLKENPSKIIVDLSQVPYMDSSGVATLIEGLQLSQQSNIEFVLCALTEGVQSIIELARLDQIFIILDSREQALGG